jgi:hypothetical protein
MRLFLVGTSIGALISLARLKADKIADHERGLRESALVFGVINELMKDSAVEKN